MNQKYKNLTIAKRFSAWAALPLCALLIDCSANGQTWINIAFPYVLCSAIACSADGKIWIGCEAGVYISTNAGANWASVSPTFSSADLAVCSADSSNLFAGGGAYVFSSTNSGSTWITNNVAGYDVTQLICSGDGSRIAAASYPTEGNPSNTPYSSNFGATFTPLSVPDSFFGSIASSSDGSKLIGTESFLKVGDPDLSLIYRSVDFGMTWSVTSAPRLEWYSLASSADGTKLAGVNDLGLCLSTNSGLTWTSNNASFNHPVVVAMSADGTRLVVAGEAEISNNIYTSLDSGRTWATNTAPAVGWSGLAMSADGSILLAVPEDRGGIYTTQIPAQPSLNISASGSNLTLSWPLPSAGFVLQQSGDLTSTNWTAVTNSVTASNYWNQVTISPPATGNVFYRLLGP